MDAKKEQFLKESSRLAWRQAVENPGIGITIFNEELREYMGVSEETAITPEEAMASHVAEAEFRAASENR